MSIPWIIRFVTDCYGEIFIAVGLTMLVALRKYAKASTSWFLLSIISCMVIMTCMWSEHHLWTLSLENPELAADFALPRWILLAIGYVARPLPILGFIYVTQRKLTQKRHLWLWIPAVINIFAMCTPYGFTVDESCNYHRGPLGYSVYVISLFYLGYVLYVAVRKYKFGKHTEAALLVVSSVFALVGAVLDGIYDTANTSICLLICSLFYYVFVRIKTTDYDMLTGLPNRQTFYEDCARLKRDVTAVASLDMNGLKLINDQGGHEEGDKGLKCIADSLQMYMSRNTSCYRVGGDEFTILFVAKAEDEIQKTILRIKREIEKHGYSICAGYACRLENEELEETFRRADHFLYLEKGRHYRRDVELFSDMSRIEE